MHAWKSAYADIRADSTMRPWLVDQAAAGKLSKVEIQQINCFTPA